MDPRQLRVDLVVDKTDIAKVQPGQDGEPDVRRADREDHPRQGRRDLADGTITQGVVNYPVRVQVDPAQARASAPRDDRHGAIVTASKEDAVLRAQPGLRTQGRTRTVEVLDADGKTAPVRCRPAWRTTR